MNILIVEDAELRLRNKQLTDWKLMIWEDRTKLLILVAS